MLVSATIAVFDICSQVLGCYSSKTTPNNKFVQWGPASYDNVFICCYYNYRGDGMKLGMNVQNLWKTQYNVTNLTNALLGP